MFRRTYNDLCRRAGVDAGGGLSPQFRPWVVSAVEKAGMNADAVAVYAMLENLPFASVLCVFAVIDVTIFFVSSSDSASYVVDVLTSGRHVNPPVRQKVFGSSAEGAIAAVFIFTAGGEILSSLKAGVVCFRLSLCLVLLCACVSLAKSLTAPSKLRTG